MRTRSAGRREPIKKPLPRPRPHGAAGRGPYFLRRSGKNPLPDACRPAEHSAAAHGAAASGADPGHHGRGHGRSSGLIPMLRPSRCQWREMEPGWRISRRRVRSRIARDSLFGGARPLEPRAGCPSGAAAVTSGNLCARAAPVNERPERQGRQAGRPRSRSRLSTAMEPMRATAPAVDDEQCDPMTTLSSVYQSASAGGSCPKTSSPAP